MAFDRAGNESADSAIVSASTASGLDNIRNVTRATLWRRDQIIVGVRNFSADAITVSRMRISWVGGAPTRSMHIWTRIPTSAGWVTACTRNISNGVIINFNGVDPVFTAYGITPANYEGIFRIDFDRDIAPGMAITIELNPHLSPPTATFDVYW